MDYKGLRHEIETRFQLALTLSIFLPALLSAFLDTAGVSKDQVNKISLPWTGLVGFFLLDYVFFAIIKKKVSDRMLRWINGLLLAGIGLFIIPVSFLATLPTDQTGASFLNRFLFKISVNGLPFIPVVILGFLVASVIVFSIKYKK